MDHISLDDGADNLVSLQENLMHGTTAVQGPIGGARRFNGTSDVIALHSHFSAPVPAISLCAWARTSFSGPSAVSNWALIDFDRSEYFNLYVDGVTGAPGFSTSGGTIHDLTAEPLMLNDGEWHHICGTYDGVDKRIYVDGELAVHAANPHGGKPLGTGATRFGFIGDGSEAFAFDGVRNNLYFQGDIDDVRVYGRSLADEEVALLHAAKDETPVCTSVVCRGLVDHIPLDDGAENIAQPQENVMYGTTSVEGPTGRARRFNGTTDLIALRSSFSQPVPEISLCAWAKTSFSGTSMSSNWALIDFDRSEYFNLYVHGVTGAPAFSTFADTVDDLAAENWTLNDGEWHHICGTYDGADKRIFVDGVLAVHAPNPHGGQPLGTGVTRFGFIGDGSEALTFDGENNGFYFEGDIDDVRVYNSALTDEEVSLLYSAQQD